LVSIIRIWNWVISFVTGSGYLVLATNHYLYSLLDSCMPRRHLADVVICSLHVQHAVCVLLRSQSTRRKCWRW